jgi:hypothetical protein
VNANFFLFQWPVGLKNVGQTCWFSAVIQSLFYLPAFRTLVLNYRPPASYIPDNNDDDTNKRASPFDDRQRKIIEFMLVSIILVIEFFFMELCVELGYL